MLALTFTALLLLGRASLSPELELELDRPGALLPPRVEPKDPCGGREGWVGDGEDGRDPPPCEGPDADGGDDPAGLHEPDWLRTGEGGDDEEAWP